MSKDMEVCTGTSNTWLLDFKENNFAGENIACLKGSNGDRMKADKVFKGY